VYCYPSYLKREGYEKNLLLVQTTLRGLHVPVNVVVLTEVLVLNSKLRGVLRKSLILLHEQLVQRSQLSIDTKQPGRFLPLLLTTSEAHKRTTDKCVLNLIDCKSS
jgi:hypothetical protein